MSTHTATVSEEDRSAPKSKVTWEVDRLVKTLAKEDGITGAFREDREVLLVTTPSWNTAQLQEWVTRYIDENIHNSNR